jgi:hypothetical protein
MAPGDTLYNFHVPNQLLLGIAKMGPSHKLVLTSGGQSNTATTDNKWIVTTMRGTILDTTHAQINNTAGQGFGFRDLAWNGQWLLTSDNAQVRRIDTLTFTELVPTFPGPGALQRGIAVESPNRIWKSDFTASAIILFDTTGAQIKSLGIPTVAPYGLGFDKWTSRNRGWLWYTQPSTAGIVRLSKVDTATGAIVRTFDYAGMFPATSSSGGLDIINDHPDYPGAVVAVMVTQLGIPGGGIITAIYLGPDSTLTGVDENESLPSEFSLSQNYPNPFNPSTTVSYDLPRASRVTIAVYDVLGRLVTTLKDDVQSGGRHSVVWDARNNQGASVSSGVYFYRMEARPTNGTGSFISLNKMLLMK